MGNCATTERPPPRMRGGPAQLPPPSPSDAGSYATAVADEQPDLMPAGGAMTLEPSNTVTLIQRTSSLRSPSRHVSARSLRTVASFDSEDPTTARLWLAPHIPRSPSEPVYLTPIKIWCFVAQRAGLAPSQAAVVAAYFLAPKVRFSAEKEDVLCYKGCITQHPKKKRPRRTISDDFALAGLFA